MARVAGSGHQAGGCAARGRLSVPVRRNHSALERRQLPVLLMIVFRDAELLSAGIVPIGRN
jgi:hypothetical protein